MIIFHTLRGKDYSMSKANINTTSNKFTMDEHVKDGTLIYLVYGPPILQYFIMMIKFICFIIIIVISKEALELPNLSRKVLYIN